jgi:hypothetical protein
MRKALAVIILVPLLGVTLWVWGSLTFVYASGDRAGYIQKFSRKGWVFKTWEGELAMVNLPGAMPEIFQFTVRHDDTARQIQDVIGQRVTVHYDQHRGLPGRVFGDTSYFVTRVTPRSSSSSSTVITSTSPVH